MTTELTAKLAYLAAPVLKERGVNRVRTAPSGSTILLVLLRSQISLKQPLLPPKPPNEHSSELNEAWTCLRVHKSNYPMYEGKKDFKLD